MRKLIIILLFFVALTSRAQHKTYRNDILVCGQIPYSVDYYFAGYGEDFMAKHGLLPGDTVAIKTGPNGEDTLRNVDLTNASLHGLTFVVDKNNKTQIKCGWLGLGNNAYDIKQNWKWNGGYGIRFYDSLHFGLSMGCVGDNEACYFEVDGSLIGAQLITTFDHTYPVNYQSLNIHHFLMQNTVNEACYFGYVHLSPIMMKLWVHDFTIKNAGRDAVQTRNTSKVLIENGNIDGVGLTKEWGQNHCIDFGSCKDSGIVRNVAAKNISGCGIWNDGFGNYLFENNNITSEGESIFTRAYQPNTPNWGDDQNIGFENTVIKCNTFKSSSGVTLELLYDTASHKSVSVTALNNNCNGVFHIPAGVSSTLINNNYSATCSIVPLPVKLISFIAQKVNQAVQLKWIVEGTDKIEVERSTDGINFSFLGTGILNKYVDMHPAYGKNYYRLKMYEEDGSFSYSHILAVTINGKHQKLVVYNVGGQTLMQGYSEDEQEFKGALKKGVYYFVYDNSLTETFIKQ